MQEKNRQTQKFSGYWQVPKYRVPFALFFVCIVLSMVMFLWGGGPLHPRILPLVIGGGILFILAFVIAFGFIIIPSKNTVPTPIEKKPGPEN